MMFRVAIALCALLAVGGLAMAAEPAGPESENMIKIEPEAEAPPAANSEDDTDSSDAPADAADQPPPPPNVYRHRPGACPEGPPCKDE
jgi:hypothetical protein